MDAGAADSNAVRRLRMVREQIERRGVRDPRVLQAMREVPRERFLPEAVREFAFDDAPQPVGCEQTISQPYIVAAMTELLRPEPTHRVLEIGTGTGYQTAVLARLVREVFSLEILPALHDVAKEQLRGLGVRNARLRLGDGWHGWPQYAPYDGIVVTAAPDRIPPALVDQLRAGGRLVIPVGPLCRVQELLVVEKQPDGRVVERPVMGVRFVPMVKAGVRTEEPFWDE